MNFEKWLITIKFEDGTTDSYYSLEYKSVGTMYYGGKVISCNHLSKKTPKGN